MNKQTDKERLLRLLDQAPVAASEGGEAAANSLHELLSAAAVSELTASTAERAGKLPQLSVSELSRSVLIASRADLARNRRSAYNRRVVRALFASLLPLPIIATVATWTLSNVHSALLVWVPGLVADYLVASYASLGVLLIGATYAAIPLLAERSPAAPAASLVQG